MIEDILQGDDVEVAFPQRVVFERTGDNPLAMALAGRLGIGSHNFVAMALPVLHDIEKPAVRTATSSTFPGWGSGGESCPPASVVIVETLDVGLVVHVGFGLDAGIMRGQFPRRDSF